MQDLLLYVQRGIERYKMLDKFYVQVSRLFYKCTKFFIWAEPYRKTVSPRTAKVYIDPISSGGSLLVIVEVLVMLVELSTTNKIVAAVRVSILSHHE